jgi:hypothetical protein
MPLKTKDGGGGMNVVIFKWRDASLHGQITKFYDDIDSLERITLITAGIVVKQDEEEITICMDYSPSEISWRSCQTYPKSCIEILKQIKIPNKILPMDD